MDGLGPWIYLGIFLGSAGLSLLFTPMALRFALRKTILDEPGGHKAHSSPIPYLGGVAIAASFAVVTLAAAVIRQPPGGIEELGTILGVALGLSLIGLLDDLRGLGVIVRFGAQIGAGVALWAIGTGVQLVGVPWIDLLITVLWTVGVTNAFNLLDNMDGLSAGVAAIAALSFFAIALVNGQFLVAALSIALVGCALGFFRHNFHPARIYMGDAGSLFLGFLLAAIGIKLRFDAPQSIAFFVPITVLGIAILDTTLVTVMRLRHGRSPFLGGRDHMSHRLVFVGIPVPVAVALICGGALAHGWLAMIMSRLDGLTGYLLMGYVVATDLFVGVLLANVPVYETSSQRRLMIREVKPHEAAADEPKVSA